MNKSTVLELLKANPAWLAGLIDGEGSFGVSISKRLNKKEMLKWKISTTFYLGLHGKDRFVLEAIKEYLGCGLITTAGIKSGFFFSYQIKANGDLLHKLIPLLDTYPLLTTKSQDYLDFKTVVLMVSKKEHLTLEGFHKIEAIKAGMNRNRKY